MNQQQKAERYDWLLGQYKGIERQINQIPKLPLEETLSDINSVEYTPQNQITVNQLKQKLMGIDMEVKKLFQ